MADIRWIDFRSIGIEGQAWQDMPHESVYDRFPAEFKSRLPESVWVNSHSSTGMCISFITDSPVIYIRRDFAEAQLEEHNFNNCSFSGFDLYAEDRPGKFRWVATTSHHVRHGVDDVHRRIQGGENLRKFQLHVRGSGKTEIVTRNIQFPRQPRGMTKSGM